MINNPKGLAGLVFVLSLAGAGCEKNRYRCEIWSYDRMGNWSVNYRCPKEEILSRREVPSGLVGIVNSEEWKLVGYEIPTSGDVKSVGFSEKDSYRYNRKRDLAVISGRLKYCIEPKRVDSNWKEIGKGGKIYGCDKRMGSITFQKKEYRYQRK